MNHQLPAPLAADLLALAQDDKCALHWPLLGPVNRVGGKALTPAELSC